MIYESRTVPAGWNKRFLTMYKFWYKVIQKWWQGEWCYCHIIYVIPHPWMYILDLIQIFFEAWLFLPHICLEQKKILAAIIISNINFSDSQYLDLICVESYQTDWQKTEHKVVVLEEKPTKTPFCYSGKLYQGKLCSPKHRATGWAEIKTK